MTQVVIYSRFSPRRNAEESESCETQEQLCREHASRQGWPVRSAHRDEEVSGNDPNKPGLAAALADLRRGDLLLVYRRDRMARDAFLAELVRRQVAGAGARIVALQGEAVDSDDDSPEARFVRQVLDAVAELERKLIGARTRSAMRAQQARGKLVSHHPPYGYRAEGGRLVPEPTEQQAVRRALRLADSGLSAWQVARKLDGELPRLARGKRWSARTVSKIIEREAGRPR